LGKWLITVTESVFYIVVTYYMYHTGATKFDYFFIAILAVAVALTFSDAGIDSKLFNNNFIYRLGRFSVPLYFAHIFCAKYLSTFVPVFWRIRYRLLIYLVISFCTAFVVMLLARMIRLYMPKILAFLKKHLVEADGSVH